MGSDIELPQCCTKNGVYQSFVQQTRGSKRSGGQRHLVADEYEKAEDGEANISC